MELMLFIGNDCIDAVTIEQSFIVYPGYVSHFVRLLKKRNEQLLLQVIAEPEFLLHGISVAKPKEVIKLSEAYLSSANAQGYKQAV